MTNQWDVLIGFLSRGFLGLIFAACLLAIFFFLSGRKTDLRQFLILAGLFALLIVFIFYKYPGGFPEQVIVVQQLPNLPSSDSAGQLIMSEGGANGDFTVGEFYVHPASGIKIFISEINTNNNSVIFDAYPNCGYVGQKYQIYCDDQEHTLCVKDAQFAISASGIKLIDNKNYVKLKIQKI